METSGSGCKNKSRKEKRKPKEALGLVTNSIMQIGGYHFSKKENGKKK